ncbi:unnamed protein product [Rotaria socialis]|nr:unnamed protein product [Rotaria socialis]CAF3453709.1 unnamed protein product [Rotaria socialis]CAF3474125.1 unnamed protein product [Rotaria socialis]CAF3495954.1 unnamed protein product [Rotaria socialis]
MTVAGGNGSGNAINKLNEPYGLFVDDNQTVVIADCSNHRIMQWKKGDMNGQVVAGGNRKGAELNYLNVPTDVLIDKETDSLVICDRGNRRIVRWSRHSDTTQGEIMIDKIGCYGLAMDDHIYLYVSDQDQRAVMRYQLGTTKGTVVAGGNGKGPSARQLDIPTYLFVDRQQNVYISDSSNHRVMKWSKDATQGITVAGG